MATEKSVPVTSLFTFVKAKKTCVFWSVSVQVIVSTSPCLTRAVGCGDIVNMPYTENEGGTFTLVFIL